jgi:hypothetical protein
MGGLGWKSYCGRIYNKTINKEESEVSSLGICIQLSINY